jgi:hypothetical protein
MEITGGEGHVLSAVLSYDRRGLELYRIVLKYKRMDFLVEMGFYSSEKLHHQIPHHPVPKNK